MRSVRFRLLSTLAALAAAILTVSAADPFESDNTAVLSVATLAHGVTQTRDLDGSGDIDYIAVDPVPGFSYEVRVMTAGFFTANLSRRNGSDGVVQAGDTLPVGTTRLSTGQLTGGSSHSSSVMRWIESANAAERTRYLRIDSGGAVRTAANSQYTVDFRETTLYCPRYNNSGTQTTVLIMQTAMPPDVFSIANGCNWEARFHDGAYNVFGHALNGSLTGSNSSGNALATNGTIVVSTATYAPASSGSIRIANTCGYGGVQAKAVALEPATGFAFDTTCLPRPY